MVPACSFALSLPDSRARSAFQLHRRNRLAPIPAISLPHARCAFTGQLIRLLSPSPLPSGSFSLPRDQSVQRALPPSGSSSESTRFPLAPRRPSIASMGLGSSSAIRYVSGDSLLWFPACLVTAWRRNDRFSPSALPKECRICLSQLPIDDGKIEDLATSSRNCCVVSVPWLRFWKPETEREEAVKPGQPVRTRARFLDVPR